MRKLANKTTPLTQINNESENSKNDLVGDRIDILSYNKEAGKTIFQLRRKTERPSLNQRIVISKPLPLRALQKKFSIPNKSTKTEPGTLMYIGQKSTKINQLATNPLQPEI